jgi:hypothetical protein
MRVRLVITAGLLGIACMFVAAVRSGPVAPGSTSPAPEAHTGASDAPRGEPALVEAVACRVPVGPSHHSVPAARGPRPVRPEPPPADAQEMLARAGPIFDALPHLQRDDIFRLAYFCPADFNKDNQIDELDLQMFVQVWGDDASPLFNWCDLNADGVIDEADTAEFIRLYQSGDCDPRRARDYRLEICMIPGDYGQPPPARYVTRAA